jgi:hypothetical protein
VIFNRALLRFALHRAQLQQWQTAAAKTQGLQLGRPNIRLRLQAGNYNAGGRW